MNWVFRFGFAASVVAILAVTNVQMAKSATISLEPDSFSDGTALTSAFPGVTLSVVGKPSTAVISIDGTMTIGPSAPNNIASTGSLVFGQNPATGNPCCLTGQFWNEDEFGLLRADFDFLALSVSIDLIFDDDDSGFLRAYNSVGALLAESTGADRETSLTVSILRTQQDIAYITAGGFNDEGLLLDNLLVATPVPAALPLFLSGLLGLGVMARRRKKPSPV